MEVLEVDPREYRGAVRNYASVFDTADFALLNAHKTDRIHFLLFQEAKRVLGVILGGQGNAARLPFSAPYGCFSWIKTRPRVSDFYAAVEALEGWCRQRGYRSLELRLPPAFYQEGVISSLWHALFGRSFQVSVMDLNHHLPLSEVGVQGGSGLDAKARQKLKVGEDAALRFLKLEEAGGLSRAYRVIQANREAKGYPLRMGLEELLRTRELIPGWTFVVQSTSGEDLAAAIVFLTRPGIAQVIYWGNVPGSEALHPMNFLAWKLETHLREVGLRILDIGPSTDGGVPNHGLCDFKQSIGCLATVKPVMLKGW